MKLEISIKFTLKSKKYKINKKIRKFKITIKYIKFLVMVLNFIDSLF